MYSSFKKESGIYIIKNTINNKVYIGSAKCLYSRIKDHLKRLKSNSHRNNYLQNHYNKYNNSIYFDVICICRIDELLEKEQFYIDLFQSYKRKKGFNINPTASNRLGAKHSEKTKKEYSTKRKGVKFSDEAKKNMSLAKQGSNHSRSKLNEFDVLEIRNNNTNKRNYSLEMSLKYNVSWSTINYILKRRTWKHI